MCHAVLVRNRMGERRRKRGEKERIEERGKQRERDKETKRQIVAERTYESVMG